MTLAEKSPPPLLGFNNNVRHRGRIFHIQTEDSGVKHARIMTHLFADGGRIVQSLRTDYGEHLGREDMAQVVRQMMKEQHKAMFVRLRAGALDEQIEGACGPLPSPTPDRAPPPNPRAGAPGSRTDDAGAEPARPAPPVEQPPLVPLEASPARPSEPAPRPRSLSNPSLRRVVPHLPPPASGGLDFDLPELAEEAAGREEPVPAPASPPPGPAPNRRAPAPEEDARYGHSRLATIFGELPLPGASIFGEPMTEKSLDEVILSYLAEDLKE